MATPRHSNNDLRKICDCARRQWAKCPHDWHFNFKPRGGRAWRFSLDVEVGRRLKSKEEAQTEAEHIRIAIRGGTFVRASERPPATTSATPDGITLAALRDLYVERRGHPSGATMRDACDSFSLLAAWARRRSAR